MTSSCKLPKQTVEEVRQMRRHTSPWSTLELSTVNHHLKSLSILISSLDYIVSSHFDVHALTKKKKQDVAGLDTLPSKAAAVGFFLASLAALRPLSQTAPVTAPPEDEHAPWCCCRRTVVTDANRQGYDWHKAQAK